MKKEVEYHEVSVRFAVSTREARRATEKQKKSEIRSALSQLIYNAICGNDTNVLDVEDVKIEIDGVAELG